MIVLTVLTILLSSYVLIESHTALVQLPCGIRAQFCCKAKYIAAHAAASAYIWYAATSDDHAVQWLVFISSATLALFVWPRMAWRWRRFYESVRGDKDA